MRTLNKLTAFMLALACLTATMLFIAAYSDTAAQGPIKPQPTPLPEALNGSGVGLFSRNAITEPHRPFDPRELQPGHALPGSGYPWWRVTRSAPLRAMTAPTGVDLDVTYINRSPMYNRYCLWYPGGKPLLCPGTENEKRWPDPGEVVTFTAHIVNKGTLTSPTFTYRWFIDGMEVVSGTHPALAPGAEGTATYQWVWAHTMEGERVVDDHTVRFTVDPANVITETYESNNSLEDRTNALGLRIAITPDMVEIYNTPWNPLFPYSAENWLQRQVAAMNEALANSIYPTTPHGATERVRINQIEITPNRPINDRINDGGWFVDADYRQVSGYYDPTTDIDWGLVHELSHQVGLIDLYNLDIPVNNVQVLDQWGEPANFSFRWPRPGLMFGGDIAPHTDSHLYSSHSAAGISSTKGYRRGYYGEYQYDIPQENYLLVLDSQGNPVSNVQLSFYQRNSSFNWAWELMMDNIPEISGVTGPDGRLLLTNRTSNGGATTRTGHTLDDNPFGVVDVVGKENRFLVKLNKEDHEEFAWLDITAFNLAYWQGQTDSHTFTLPTHVPPAEAPTAPDIASVQVEGDQATLCWTATSSADVVGYYVYRAGSPTYTYERTGPLMTELCFTESYYNGNRLYTVTAVDSQGRESGFSRPVWAPRLLHPYAVDITADGRRVILDPQNGHALLRQDASGRYIQNIGSPHYHLEYSRFLAVDAEDRLLISHPGDFYTDRHSVRLADEAANPLLEFGQRGSSPGRLDVPTGVATWTQPCGNSACLTRFLVADSGNHRLQVFDEFGNFVNVYGSFGDGPGQFDTPQGLVVNSQGQVIVADTGNHRLQILNFDGTAFNFFQSIKANLNEPTGVAINETDETDLIIVADPGDNLVKIFDENGNVWAVYDAPNDGQTGSFYRPHDVAVDEETIVVADTGNRRVVTIENAFAPQAAFSAMPVSGTIPLTVTFADQSVGYVTNRLWDFGDGQSSSEANPQHIYTTPGSYTVTLTISAANYRDVVSQTNYVTAYAPVQADFTTSPTSGQAPLTVVFTNTSTGDYTTTLWDFGDGTTSSEAIPTHTYTAAGSYTVTLTVSGLGGSDTTTAIISVTEATPDNKIYLPLIVR